MIAKADGPISLYPSPNERFGFGVVTNINDYDAALLHAGWYVNWGAAPEASHPAGLEYAQIIRVCDETYRRCNGHAYRPYGAQLAAVVADNPGSLWMIGNEPDCIYQDSVGPESYAVIYHDVYEELKRLDSTARVAIGGIVQFTPLRRDYLNVIWNTYRGLYGEPMPVDVWNTHNFILREERDNWGCDIPPGIPALVGEMREISDHDRVDLFEEQLQGFRVWMADHGQQNKPLIVSEYGILFPEELGYSYQRVRNFMLASFDSLQALENPTTGYPLDGDRLVQCWAWYSLDDVSFEWGVTWSALFTPTGEILSLGQDFADYTEPLVVPYYDLQPVTLTLDAPTPLIYGQPATVTLRSRVVNWGNSPSGPLLASFWDGDTLLGDRVVPGLASRYEGHTLAEVSWTEGVTCPHLFRVAVESKDAEQESRLDNNEATLLLNVDLAVEAPRMSVFSLAGAQTPVVTVTATASNLGDVTVENAVVKFYEHPSGAEPQPLHAAAVSLGAGVAEDVSFAWLDPLPGTHIVSVAIDADSAVVESNEGNNLAEESLLITDDRVLLPLVSG